MAPPMTEIIMTELEAVGLKIVYTRRLAVRADFYR